MSESTDSVRSRVRDYILDPVGVTLAASIDDEDVGFKDPRKSSRHSLFEARTLDIWDGHNGARRLDRTYPLSRSLPEQLFEAYHPASEHDERLAMRLLVTRPMLASNQIAWIDDLGKQDHKQINHLPFVPEDIEDLIRQWDLPREWPWLRVNAREVGNFQRKTEWDFSTRPPTPRRMGIIIHFPFVLRPAKREDYLNEAKGGKTAGRRTARSEYNPWRDDPFIWSFAMSHSLRDGKTRGLLDGLTDWAFGDVARRILKVGGRWYQHPLHVPVILLNIFFDHAAWEINRLCVDVSEFENLSKNAMVDSLDKYDAITTELNYVRRTFDFQSQLVKFLLETLNFIEQRVFDRQIGPDMSTYISYVYETNPHMEEKLQNILHLIQNNLSTCAYLQSRSKDALDFIKGAMAQRDNESGQVDAESNKVMSFLQMTFLPATFVAAILSINMFDFTKDPPVIYSSIWVFWIIAISLTTIVLAVYFSIKFYQKREIKRKQEEAKKEEDQERESLVRPPSDGTDDDDDGRGRFGRRRKRRKTTNAEGSKKHPEVASI